VKTDSKNPWEGLVVVVENKQEKKGLFVDDLLGQEEVGDQKSWRSTSRNQGLAGGAIMETVELD
jgi:chemotaxis protein histidine kinase CheA